MLTGCGGSAATPDPTATAAPSASTAPQASSAAAGGKLLDGRHLVVGMSLGYPNFEEEVLDANGKLVVQGLDIDILDYMSEDLGFTYEISNMGLPECVAGLQSGMCDITISGMYETPERLKSIDMSQGYLTAKSGMLYRKADGFSSTADLNGKTVSCSNGESYYESILPTIEGATVSVLDNAGVSIQALINGLTDAVIIDGGTCEDIVGQYPELSYFMLTNDMIEGVESNHYSMGFPKGSDLTSIFNDEIDKMRDNGKLSEIITQWLGAGMAE